MAHRGASGTFPGHTLAAYEEAVRAGADWIEFDCHSTADGHCVITHDIEVATTTDVADVFPDRRKVVRAPCVDGEPEEMDSWFCEQFTLEELKQLTVHHQFKIRSARDEALPYRLLKPRSPDIPSVLSLYSSRQFCAIFLPMC